MRHQEKGGVGDSFEYRYRPRIQDVPLYFKNMWEIPVLERQALCTFKVCLVLARFWLCSESKSISHSVMANSLGPHGL